MERRQKIDNYKFKNDKFLSLGAELLLKYGLHKLNVKLLFSKDVAEDVLNYNFHPTQKIKQNEDGTVTVKFKASGSLAIMWHLFKWGDGVKILSPLALKKEYQNYLLNVLAAQK